MKLLLVKSERKRDAIAHSAPFERYLKNSALVVVPDGWNDDTALNHTILPFPDPYVVAVFEIIGYDPLVPQLEDLRNHPSLNQMSEYTSYTEND